MTDETPSKAAQDFLLEMARTIERAGGVEIYYTTADDGIHMRLWGDEKDCFVGYDVTPEALRAVMTQPRSEAACSSVPRECNFRPEGWYLVRFENWDGGHDDWCPAWWNGMCWGSYRYSGIPDSRTIVGDKIVMPNSK